MDPEQGMPDGFLNVPNTFSSALNVSPLCNARSFLEPYCRDLAGRVSLEDRFPFASGGNSNIYRGQLLLSDSHLIRVRVESFT
jgi:hypothetical protein